MVMVPLPKFTTTTTTRRSTHFARYPAVLPELNHCHANLRHLHHLRRHLIARFAAPKVWQLVSRRLHPLFPPHSPSRLPVRHRPHPPQSR